MQNFYLFLSFIFFYFIFFTNGDDNSQNVIKFYNKTNSAEIISYGIQLPGDQILLPQNANELFASFGEAKYFNDRSYFLTGLYETKYMRASLIQLNEHSFILKQITPSLKFYRDVLTISRYPATFNLEYKTFLFDTRSNKQWNPQIRMLSADTCIKLYPNFNKNIQACGIAGNEKESGKPLIAVIDDNDFVVGLSAPKTSENATLFNLIVPRSADFPYFKKCSNLIDSAKESTVCNSVKISKELKLFGREDVVLVGNIQGENDLDSFIPFGLATVVSNDQAIIPSTVFQSLKNYDIYGNGRILKLALMMDGIPIVPSYHHFSSFEKLLKIVKFDMPIFNNTQKAIFSFHDLEKDVVVETFQFTNEEEFRVQEDVEKTKKFQKFYFGAPVFRGDIIVGFKDAGHSYTSITKLEKFLHESIFNLITEATSTTFTSTSAPATTFMTSMNLTDVLFTTTSSFESQTATSPFNTKLKTSDTVKHFAAFWLLFLTLFF